MNADSKSLNDTFYSVLGLRDFASSTEIEAAYREFETNTKFSDLRDGQFGGGLRNVFSVLLSPKKKQWYDLLLEAQLRSEGFLPPILDPAERDSIQAFAHEMGLRLISESEWVLRIHPETNRETTRDLDFAIRQFPAKLGKKELAFYAFPCSAYTAYDFNFPQISLRWEHVHSIPLRSQNVRVIAGNGDKVILISILHDPADEQFQAAYINESRNVFSPLEHADNSLFLGSRNEVAERLGIRARPESIRKVIRQYYAQLANAICHFGPEADQELVQVTCLRFAKKVLSTR